MAETKQKTRRLPEPIATLDEWLSSLPIAVAVMIILALLSALGTVIPQEHLAQRSPEAQQAMYIEKYGAATYNDIPLGKLTLSIPTSKMALIEKFGLTKIYYTHYFLVLMVWLSLSSLICTTKRWRMTYRQWKHPKVECSPRYFKNNKLGVVLNKVSPEAAEQVSADLKTRRYRTVVEESEGVTFIYGDRGFSRQWWLVALHVSIIILIAGGIYGEIYGVNGSVVMPDGAKQVLSVDFKKDKPDSIRKILGDIPNKDYNLDQSHFRIDYDKKIQLPSYVQDQPEDIRDYYAYFVKDFVSELTVERNGKSKTQEVKVNHPLKLDKLVMYQSSYRQGGYLEVEYGGSTREYSVPSGMWLVVSPNGLMSSSQAMDSGIRPSHAFYLEQVKAGDLYIGGENTGYLGPMTILRAADMTTGQQLPPRIISPERSFTTVIDGETATIRMSRKIDNTSIFAYKLDPGIPIIYFGWILMTLGITFAMYVGLTRVNIRIEADGRMFMLVRGRGGVEGARMHYERWRKLTGGK